MQKDTWAGKIRQLNPKCIFVSKVHVQSFFLAHVICLFIVIGSARSTKAPKDGEARCFGKYERDTSQSTGNDEINVSLQIEKRSQSISSADSSFQTIEAEPTVRDSTPRSEPPEKRRRIDKV